MEIRNVSVVGAGVMGCQIAQLCAQNGFPVTLMDVSSDALAQGLRGIEVSLEKFFVRKSKMSPEEASQILRRISAVTDLTEAARSADLVFEAVYEDLELKKQLFKKLDEHSPPHTILASNTSSLSISELASATRRPTQVVGTHFFNPIAVMKLVELVKGLASQENLSVVKEFVTKMGKTVVSVKDSPGFITSRMIAVMVNEALWLVHTGVASPGDIDTAMRLGLNHPVGPIELVETLASWPMMLPQLEFMERELGDPRYAPCPLMRTIIRGGYLGKASAGKGLYEYYEEHMK